MINIKKNILSNLLLILFLIYSSQQLIISHQQITYRLGSNYAGQSNTQTINNCDQNKVEEQTFSPQPVQQITITCTLPRVFNQNTNSCECLAQTIFDPTTSQCLCPPQRPLWNGKECVKCPDNMYFDAEQRQCYLCPQGFIHTKGSSGKLRCEQSY